MIQNQNFKLIGPFNQLLTMQHLPLKGPLGDEKLEIMDNAGILCQQGIIQEVGHFNRMEQKARIDSYEIERIESPAVCMPGFIDAHTHLCFAGSRAMDYALRNSGSTYLEIAKSGGGILQSVALTRASSFESLMMATEQRINRHVNAGITTIEIKSGYGLDVESEIKMLSVINKLKLKTSIDLIPTCLAAHTIPPEFKGDPGKYLDFISYMLLPIIKEKKLSNRVDIFIEDTAFTPEISKKFLEHAKGFGFRLTIHADQFTPGGSALAVELGASSADHLEASGDLEINALATSNTVATVLPGASMGLGLNFAPARKILDAGGCLAIASDWNPGSAPMGDLLLQSAVLGAYEKLTAAEVLSGITFRAANALNLTDRGKLAPGQLADFIAFPCSDYREILYHQGKLMPEHVWKLGTKRV